MQQSNSCGHDLGHDLPPTWGRHRDIFKEDYDGHDLGQDLPPTWGGHRDFFNEDYEGHDLGHKIELFFDCWLSPFLDRLFLYDSRFPLCNPG